MSAGAGDVILYAMRVMSGFQDVQSSGCYAIARLAANADAKASLLLKGALQVSRSALRAFPSDRNCKIAVHKLEMK